MGNGDPLDDGEWHMQRTVVVRRFDGEPLEVVALAPLPPAPALAPARGCRITSWTVGDVQLYQVELPDGYAVRPVDWRRFATHLVRVRERIEACVRDNLAGTTFEPWTEVTRERAAARLALALQDLSSMIDVYSVQCVPGERPEDRCVEIEFRDVERCIRQWVVSVAEESSPWDRPP